MYEGEWEDGKMDRKGMYTYADGTVYEGEWKDGKQYGQGKRTFDGGAVYEGELEDGRMHVAPHECSGKSTKRVAREAFSGENADPQNKRQRTGSTGLNRSYIISI